ncbi:hypothetical protein [Metabacillus indicus]|uniref:hypothetical protein n=1 Tax=Metabacillus indicus TaxID=246786 RepID=UPI003CF5E554
MMALKGKNRSIKKKNHLLDGTNPERNFFPMTYLPVLCKMKEIENFGLFRREGFF